MLVATSLRLDNLQKVGIIFQRYAVFLKSNTKAPEDLESDQYIISLLSRWHHDATSSVGEQSCVLTWQKGWMDVTAF